MGLQIIMGKSGSGKSSSMMKKIIKETKNFPMTSESFLCIVPEQFSLEAQKNLVEASGGKGSFAVDVLSFNRLAYVIFEEQNKDVLKVLDDTAKSLILRKIAEENKDNLNVLKGNDKKGDFSEEIKSVISEIYQYGLTTEDIKNASEQKDINGGLKSKLEDINLLMSAFEEYIRDKYTVNEELIVKAGELVKDSAVIRDSNIFLDEYTGFTPVQFKFIGELLKYAKNVYVAVTLRDPDSVDFVNTDTAFDNFGLAIKTVNKLKSIAKENHVEIYEDIICRDNVRFKEEEIVWLENNIFKHGIRNKKEINNDVISVHSCKDIKSEAMYVAYNIKELIKENYRYKDIAVVTGNLEGYSDILSKYFDKYDIPYFMDYSREMLTNPIIEGILSLLEITVNNFTYESVFRFLKSGLSSVKKYQVDLFENICLEFGLKGRKKYTEANEFIDNNRKMFPKIREEFVKNISFTDEVMKNGRKFTASEGIDCLEKFMEYVEVEKKIYHIKKEYEKAGDKSRVKEYEQIYEKILELFDKIREFIGDEKMNVSEFKGILESGLKSIKVGVIPPTLDRVVVGDIERTRLNNIKVLFFVGVNDGEMMSASRGTRVISDDDRSFLEAAGMGLAPTSKENIFIQRYYLYLILTKMSERLFISYRSIGEDGNSKKPDFMIKYITGLFKNVNIYYEDADKENYIWSKESLKDYIAANNYKYASGMMKEEEEEVFTDSYLFAKKNCEDINVDMLVNAVHYKNVRNNLDKEVVKMIYGKRLKNSVTRLERFSECQYKHFLQNGLSLYPRKEMTLGYNDVGTVNHGVLEKYFRGKYIDEDKRDEFDDEGDPKKRREIIGRCIEELQKELLENKKINLFPEGEKNEFIKQEMTERLTEITGALDFFLDAGRFEVSDLEYSFDTEKMDEIYELDKGYEMSFRGAIDRIDIYKDKVIDKDGKEKDVVFVKIVDYKTNGKTPDPVLIYNGLQLQLPMYMNIAMEHIKKKEKCENVEPAGIFYQALTSEVDNKNPIKEEDLKHEYIKGIRPRGYINDYNIGDLKDGSLIYAYDKNPEPGEDLKSVRIKLLKKTGLPNKASEKIIKNNKEMNNLCEFAKAKAIDIGNVIVSGSISVNPYKIPGKNDDTGCKYCDYSAVCRFGSKEPGCDYNFINADAEKCKKEIFEKEDNKDKNKDKDKDKDKDKNKNKNKDKAENKAENESESKEE